MLYREGKMAQAVKKGRVAQRPPKKEQKQAAAAAPDNKSLGDALQINKIQMARTEEEPITFDYLLKKVVENTANLGKYRHPLSAYG